MFGRPVFGTQRPGRDGYEDGLLAERLWDDAVVAALRGGNNLRCGVARYRTLTRSTTKTRVSPGLITLPAPRSP